MDGNICSNFKPVRRRKDRLLQNGFHEYGIGRKKKSQQDFTVFVNVVPPVVAVFCYLNGLEGNFVHDDVFAIKENADSTGKAPIGRLFENDFWGKSMCDNASHKSYRPLTVLTFRLDYYLGGGAPWQFHVVNVALHALVTFLYGHLLRHVLHVHELVTAAAALLFAVHPIHTEAVTGIVGRAELLSCVGVMVSLICYGRCVGRAAHPAENGGVQENASGPKTSTRPVVYFCLAALTAGAAMLCKELGIMALALCAVLDVFVFSRTATRSWLNTRKRESFPWPVCVRLSALLCVGACLMGFRLWMMCGQSAAFIEEDNPASFSTSTLTRVLTFNYLLAFNAWMLLCPRVLNYDWQGSSLPLVTGLDDVRNLATVILHAFFVSAGLAGLRNFLKQDETSETPDDSDRNNNNSNDDIITTNNTMTDTADGVVGNSNFTAPSGGRRKTSGGPSGEWSHVLLVALALMILPFLPATNLLFRVGFVVAERVLYTPSTGFCLLVAQGGVALWHRCGLGSGRHVRRGLIVVASLLLFGTMAARTVQRNRVWRSRESLFRSGIQILPHNAKMHYNYANLLKDAGDERQAEHHYRLAVKLYDKQPSYHNNLGTVVQDEGEAERCYRAALRLNPAHRGALVNLGNLLINRNDSKGEQLLHQALSTDPDYISALLSLGQLALRRGKWEEAEMYVKRGLDRQPDMPDLYHYYGIILHQTGQYEAAVDSYSHAAFLDNNFSHALTNAAASLRQLGRDDEAESFLKRAVAATNDQQALKQLGLLYHRTGRIQDAMDVYTQMVHMAPNDTDLLMNWVNILMENGQPKRAQEVLAGILSRAPHMPEALFAMGHVHQNLGLPQEALASFLEASRWASPNSALSGNILHAVGNVYKDLQMYPQALQNYQASVKANPSNTAARHNLAVLYHILGHHEQAREHYELVLREEPTNQLLLDNMAKLQQSARERSRQKTPPPPG